MGRRGDDSAAFEPDFSDDALLRQWQVCVESADRVSQRRDASNGLFTTLNLGILASSTALKGQNVGLLLFAGIGICIVWFLHLVSFKKLNTAKFAVLTAMEKRLQSQPFSDEWNELKHKNGYLNQTFLERALPVLFGFLFSLMMWESC